MPVRLTINGEAIDVQADAAKPLLWVLREDLNLTGSKFGCGIAQCGACTVHVDGVPTRSCVLPVESVVGKRITTIEGSESRQALALRDAWRQLDVVQCGYCQSGQLMSAAALLATNETPSDKDIDAAMSGNICRCATYHRIRAAIHVAANTLSGAGNE